MTRRAPTKPAASRNGHVDPAALPVEKLVELNDPVKSAHAVGLHYVADDRPGIRRGGSPKHFSYRNGSGKVIRDPATLRRIRSLAIPPAWTDVWICSDP